MTDKIISLSAYKSKLAKLEDAADPKEKFNLNIAKQIIQSDKVLNGIITTMGVSLDEAARWIISLVSLQNDIEKLIYKATEKNSFSPAFTGLIAQALASQASDQLTAIGFSGAVSRDNFVKFQKNAIQAILASKHMDDLTASEFETFENGETDE